MPVLECKGDKNMRSSKDKHIRQAVGPEVTKKQTFTKSEPTDFDFLSWNEVECISGPT